MSSNSELASIIKELEQKAKSSINDLNNIVKRLGDMINRQELEDKEKQLKEISGTVEKLKSMNVSVPDELRNIKTNLVIQIGFQEEAKNLLTDIDKRLFEILDNVRHITGASTHVKKKNPAKKLKKRLNQKKKINNIYLSDLFTAGYLKKGTKIVHHNYQGIINNRGEIEVEISGRKQSFNSPSNAAKALAGTSLNGWTWWIAVMDNGKKPLSEIRKRYKKEQNNK